MISGLIFLLLLVLVPWMLYRIIRPWKPEEAPGTLALECFTAMFYLLSIILFVSGMKSYSQDYMQPIDPMNDGYTPFSPRHLLTVVVYIILFIISATTLWLRGTELPPLISVLAQIFILASIPISIVTFIQIRVDQSAIYLFTPAVFMTILIAVYNLIRIAASHAVLHAERQYRSRILNYLNKKMSVVKYQPVWALLLLIPVVTVVTCILLLFGQDTDSMVRVWTDTTTWAFSHKEHPPFLDEHGHYLCTVAACGSPLIVRPLFVGQRHGRPIIVNRQLQVANAFEEMIQDYFPRLHKVIRHLYDRYGLELSRHIHTTSRSNLTYLAMKVPEYFFLFSLYLLCRSPEEKIKKQYKK